MSVRATTKRRTPEMTRRQKQICLMQSPLLPLASIDLFAASELQESGLPSNNFRSHAERIHLILKFFAALLFFTRSGEQLR